MSASRFMRIAFTAMSLVALCAVLCGPAWAGDYKASLAKMPVYAENPDKGALVDLTKAMAKASGNNIAIVVVPFKRSLNNVVTKAADFHMPLIQNPNLKEADLPYDHSTETIFHVNFVLYTNKNKKVDAKNLGSHVIETDAAHVTYFPFKTIPSSNMASSLKKVDAGRIDGFIFADMASDPIVKGNNLGNIKRQLYKVFDVKIILPKGGKGGPTDQMLSKAIKSLKASGEYQKIMGPLDQKYNDWQP